MIKNVDIDFYDSKRHKLIGCLLLILALTSCSQKVAKTNDVADDAMSQGDADSLVYGSFPSYVKAMKSWDRVENFKDYTYPGGTHDFPVWFKGFHDFIQMVFKQVIDENQIKINQYIKIKNNI